MSTCKRRKYPGVSLPSRMIMSDGIGRDLWKAPGSPCF